MKKGPTILTVEQTEEVLLHQLENSPNAQVTIVSTGEIVCVNKQVERTFGYAREELIGQAVEILMPERYRENHRKFVKLAFANPETRSMAAGRILEGLHRDGHEFPVTIYLSDLSIKGIGTVLVATLQRSTT